MCRGGRVRGRVGGTGSGEGGAVGGIMTGGGEAGAGTRGRSGIRNLPGERPFTA